MSYLDEMPTGDFLRRLRPLTLTQYDECKVVALQRVTKLIGEKPTRRRLRRDLGPLLTPLDALALVVFLAAFLVSSVHILAHAGGLAATTYRPPDPTGGDPGLVVSAYVYAVVHQGGFLFLAEASMLLFMVTWRTQTREERRTWYRLPRRLFSVYLLLALVAMTFVLVANLASGLTLLEALMPPVFTIGLGFHVERLVVELLDRRAFLNRRLQEALDVWERATEDPTTYPSYRQLLLREIWEKLARMKDNRDLADAPANLKRAAVERELGRDLWTEEVVEVEKRVETYREAGLTETQAEEVIAHEADLHTLAEMVRYAADGLTGRSAVLVTTAGTANLEHLTWIDHGQDDRTYGPYKTRTTMAQAIRSVANTNTRRSS